MFLQFALFKLFALQGTRETVLWPTVAISGSHKMNGRNRKKRAGFYYGECVPMLNKVNDGGGQCHKNLNEENVCEHHLILLK